MTAQQAKNAICRETARIRREHGMKHGEAKRTALSCLGNEALWGSEKYGTKGSIWAMLEADWR
jgi:hypothetical protein